MSGTGPPSLGLFLLEGHRAVLEGFALMPSRRWLRTAPRGDGQPVLVLPGFTASDGSTRVLRRFLRARGYAPHPWLLGRNVGNRDGLHEGLAARLSELASRYERKVSLVGWSLGGIYARELAKRMPDTVRQVVTLGSPFGDAGRASNVSRLFEWVSGRSLGDSREQLAARLRLPPAVPSTSIYTRSDGVVHWTACLEPDTDHTENIEVPGSHSGLGVNPLVLYAVADRLSQREGSWQPFERSGWRGSVYR